MNPPLLVSGWVRAAGFCLLGCVGGIVASDRFWIGAQDPIRFVDAASGFDISTGEQTPADTSKNRAPLDYSEASAAHLEAAIKTFSSQPGPDVLADAHSCRAFRDEFISAWITSTFTEGSATNQSSPVYSPMELQTQAFVGSINPAATAAIDPTWIGPSLGTWANPSNWSPAVVPDGPGVIVNFKPSGSGTMFTTENVSAGVTLGSLSLEGTGATTWTIGFITALTMDNNGNGAVISNVNTAVGNYGLVLTGDHDPITLADNLAITNSSGSTSSSGSINIAEWIAGSGNLTFNNVSNTINAGQIVLAPLNPSTFLGTSTIASGIVETSRPSAFGAPGNQIILGSPSGGSASLVLFGGSGFTMPNPVTVAS